jgi:hypothetical protein
MATSLILRMIAFPSLTLFLCVVREIVTVFGVWEECKIDQQR